MLRLSDAHSAASGQILDVESHSLCFAKAAPRLPSLHHADKRMQAILFETGVLQRLQPQAPELQRSLTGLFQDSAAADDFSVQQCINILSGMTLLGQFDVSMHNAIVCRCKPELTKTDPEQVGSLCYILGIAGYTNRAFCTALENLLVQRNDQFSAKALAKAVWMLGRLNFNSGSGAGVVEKLIERALREDASPTVRSCPLVGEKTPCSVVCVQFRVCTVLRDDASPTVCACRLTCFMCLKINLGFFSHV